MFSRIWRKVTASGEEPSQSDYEDQVEQDSDNEDGDSGDGQGAESSDDDMTENRRPEISRTPLETASLETAFLDEEEEECVFSSQVFKIEGNDVSLVRGWVTVMMNESSLSVVDDDLVWRYERILSVRQHRPQTCQFLYTKNNVIGSDRNKLELEEFGLHFKTPDESIGFRHELLLGLLMSCQERLITFRANAEVFNIEQKQFKSWFVDATVKVSRRKGDKLALLAIYSDVQNASDQGRPSPGQATPGRGTPRKEEKGIETNGDGVSQETPSPQTDELSNCIFISELIRDVQMWFEPENSCFTLWGPFFQQGPEYVRPIIRFQLSSSVVQDAAMIFGVLERLNGCEERLLESFVPAHSPSSDESDDKDETESNTHTHTHTGVSDGASDVSDASGDENDRYNLSNVKRMDHKTESFDPSERIIENDPNAQCHKFMQTGTSRNFVCRSNGYSSSLHWKGSDDTKFNLKVYSESLEDCGSIGDEKFVYKNKALGPEKGILHGNERSMIFLNEQKKRDGGVYSMDLEYGKVVNKLETDGIEPSMLWNTFKNGQTSGDPTFWCANKKAIFLMDTRTSRGIEMSRNGQGDGESRSNRESTLTYATNPDFTSAASDSSGHIVLGNKLGQFRLYDGEPNAVGKLKIAKTLLEGRQEAIKAVDVTTDGAWIVGTMKSCLILFPTKLRSTGKTGFETRLGSNKPEALYLRLSDRDIMKYGLQDIDFQPAVFDSENKAILTSTGNIAVIWDFKKIRKGNIKDCYKLKFGAGYIKDAKIANDGSILLAYPTDISKFPTRSKAII